MRALAIALSMLVPAAALAQTPMPGAPPPVAQEPGATGSPPPPARDPPDGEPDPVSGEDDDDASPDDEDQSPGATFEEDVPVPSLMFGPVGRGDLLASLDVGWLRSAVQANLGFGGWLDLVLRADTLLLYRQLHGQTGIHAGVRVSPVSGGLLRASVQATIGEVFVPGQLTIANLTVLSGDLTLGVALPWASVGARLGIRGLSDSGAGAGWTSQTEAGLGVERAFGKLVVGAEGFAWSRSELDTLPQWRLRVGYAP